MRWLEPAQQVLLVCIPVLAAPAERCVSHQPGVRNKCNDAVNDIGREPSDHGRIYPLESAGKLEENMVFDHGERGSAAFAVVGPCVVEVQGCTVIDEPESSMPDKHVR